MANIRLFLALVPSKPFLDGLETFRLALQDSYADLRLVPRENLHVTLKFLGSVDEARLGDIVGALAPAIETAPSSSLLFDHLISLPSARQARVVALAADCPPPVVTLVQILEGSLAALGFLREQRPFRAHLTLGRAKVRARLIREHPPIPPPQRLEPTEVVLFQSRPAPQGSRYEARGRFQLRSA